MVQIERAGTPTVGIIASGFASDAGKSAATLGMPNLKTAVTPEDCITGLTPEQISQQMDLIIKDIEDALTKAVSTDVPHFDPDARPSPAESEVFEGLDRFDAFERMNVEFLDRGWGDGFPLLPPTPERVQRMLGGTKRDPQEVVTVLAPGLGLATVEKIAINCVMAGCEPEYLPVLLAATEAIADPNFNLSMVATSTGAHTPFLVVNGPLAKKFGMNSGRCALGPGKPSRVNTAIGRALRLIMMNVGHAYPGILDMDSIGSPAKYSMCVAENEDQNPWQPLHVERGYQREQSTLTVFNVRSYMEVDDLASYTAEGVLTSFSATLAHPGGEYMESGWQYRDRCHHVLLITPDHARSLARGGFTKQGIREYLYHKTKLPWRILRNKRPDSFISADWRWILTVPPETLMPCAGSPDWYQIIVVGGAAGKSATTISEGLSITRIIEGA